MDFEADLAEADLAEDPKDEVDSEADSEAAEIEILEDPKEDQLKCMMLPAINAEINVKFLLDPQEKNLFIATTVLRIAMVQTANLAQEAKVVLLNQESLQNNSINLIQNLIRYSIF